MSKAIGIDIDGVICDNMKFITDYGTVYFGRSPIDLTQYSIAKMFQVSEEEASQFWQDNLLTYVNKQYTRDGAEKLLRELHSLNIDFMFLTDRCTYETGELARKIYKGTMHMIDELVEISCSYPNYHGTIFCNKSKLDIIKKYELSIMIDDNPEHIEEISTNIKVFKYYNSYNTEVIGDNIITVYNFDDIIKEINSL